jgi:hypothetical protein
MPQGASDQSGYGTSPDIPGAYPEGYFLPRRFPCSSMFFYPDVIINSLSFYLGDILNLFHSVAAGKTYPTPQIFRFTRVTPSLPTGGGSPWDAPL